MPVVLLAFSAIRKVPPVNLSIVQFSHHVIIARTIRTAATSGSILRRYSNVCELSTLVFFWSVLHHITTGWHEFMHEKKKRWKRRITVKTLSNISYHVLKWKETKTRFLTSTSSWAMRKKHSFSRPFHFGFFLSAHFSLKIFFFSFCSCVHA